MIDVLSLPLFSAKPHQNPKKQAPLPASKTIALATVPDASSWAALKGLALVGRSQVRPLHALQFGVSKKDEDILKQLDRIKFTNEARRTFSLGEILWNLSLSRYEYNGKDGVPGKLTGKGKPTKWHSGFYAKLIDQYGFDPEAGNQANRVLQELDKLGLIRLFSPDEEWRFTKCSLAPAAIKAARQWGKAKGLDVSLLKDRTIIDLANNEGVTVALEALIDKRPELTSEIRGQQMLDNEDAKKWLRTVVEFPHDAIIQRPINEAKAQKILDEAAYGLEEVKKRMLGIVRAYKYGGGSRGGFMIMVGPPGVGKTAFGPPLAKALGRAYVSANFNALSDEHRVTGHGKTWKSSDDGLISKGLRQAKAKNPVFLLDEIDKAGAHHAAVIDTLVAVTDREQNHAWNGENYLGFPLDVSKVFWVATINDISKIPDYLRSRAEIINMRGYLSEEKIEIALRYLVRKQLAPYKKIKPDQLQFSREAVMHLIEFYTSESGVRKLEEKIKSVILEALPYTQKARTFMVTPEFIDKVLVGKHEKEIVDPKAMRVGETSGLYWSAEGGGILNIQVATPPGSGKVKITGQLGDVMKESVEAALTTLLENAEKLNIPKEKMEQLRRHEIDLHIHAPAGATPKDGPSAGLAILTALWSQLSGIPVPAGTGMTGEIDIKGNALPIGGILEKIADSKRRGIIQYYLPESNRRTVEEECRKTPAFARLLQDVKITYVKNALEVIEDILKNHPDAAKLRKPAPLESSWHFLWPGAHKK